MSQKDAGQNEVRTEGTKGEQRIDSSATMSTALFDNPKEFLQILKEHHNEIKRPNTDYATKEDYFYAAHNAKDPTVRAAAEVVSKHFDDIAKFGLVVPSDSIERPSGINSVAIDRAMKYLAGNYKPTLYWEQSKNIGLTMFAGAGTAAMGAFTVLTAEAPPIATLFGAGTLTMGAWTGIWGYEAYNYPSLMRQRAEDTRTKLQSWPEINRYRTK